MNETDFDDAGWERLAARHPGLAAGPWRRAWPALPTLQQEAFAHLARALDNLPQVGAHLEALRLAAPASCRRLSRGAPRLLAGTADDVAHALAKLGLLLEPQLQAERLVAI